MRTALLQIPKEEDHLEDQSVDGRTILKTYDKI